MFVFPFICFLFLIFFSSDSKEGRDSFVDWLGTVDALQLEVWLEDRKSFKTRGKQELESGGLRTAAI